ncbi:WD40 repeat-like protein [Neoconidiobolus thromboides FSU 785]|nr:WD40 repeat-like protein [Neoconidiobolus thromboides FSU 785]
MNLETNCFGETSGLLSTSFNQDFGCIAIGTDKGFKIFNSDPLHEKSRKEYEDGGIGGIEMLYRSNFIALVGGGKNPKFPPNKVMIWDDIKSKFVFELEFRSVVKGIKLRRDRLIVVLATKTFVYSFGDIPQKLYTFETSLNNKGLITVSQSLNKSILAIPGIQKGHIQLIDIGLNFSHDGESNYNSATSSLANSIIMNAPSKPPPISIIAAHTSKLSCIALNENGTLLASASEKGTLIRVFNTSSGKVLHEFRRGVDRAEIYCIAFNQESTRICVSSDKGTIHIFNLALIDGFNPKTENSQGSIKPNLGNRQSSLSFMKDLLPKYFDSEWSYASYTLPNETKCICGFSPIKNSNAIIVLCSDGSYFRILFDPRVGGQCTRDVYKLFYRP